MTLFISDLHLSPNDTKTTLEFFEFLDSPIAQQAHELYILGDLFARWIGDDAMGLYEYDIAYRLSEWVSDSKKIYFMPGNRDFLIGPKFLEISRLILLPDPCSITVFEKNPDLLSTPPSAFNILLTHGDQLCSLDKSYQIYRRIAQSRITRFLFLKLPLWIRRWVANRLQRNTDHHSPPQKLKHPKYNITQTGLEYLITQNQFSGQWMIHGHTHLPTQTEHTLSTAHSPLTRIVLGDWQNYPGFYYKPSLQNHQKLIFKTK
jgi:UDP-2,3-diacylglucosamine hydrolase